MSGVEQDSGAVASVEIVQGTNGVSMEETDRAQVKLVKKGPVQVPLNEPGVGVTLDASTWPIVHGSRGSQDNSAVRQPARIGLQQYSSQDKISDELDSMYLGQLLMSYMVEVQEGKGMTEFALQAANLVNFKLSEANPVSIITQKLSNTQQILWTSTIGEVIAYRETAGKPALEKLASLTRGYNFRFHGSYAFTATHAGKTGFFTTVDDSVVRYELQGSDLRGWSVVETARVSIPADQQVSNDHFVGVTVVEDGTIAACSKYGVIVSARMDPATGGFLLMDVLPLAKYATAKPSHVSNSISSDGYGIYIATQREMVRVDYDPYKTKLVFKWSNIYGPVQPWFVGRLGPGSGSTPTVTTCGGQRLVTITDGAIPMNLIYYDTETGQAVATKKVQFGPEENGYLPTTSEQSVAVDGCKAFVVQNFMGTTNLNPDVRCTGVPKGQLRTSLADFCNSMNFNNGTDLFTVKACPSVFGCSSYGAATFEVLPHTKKPDGTMTVKRAWTRPDISCGTTIPLISTHKDSHAAYCMGLRENSNMWALIGMDMETGKDVLSYQLYKKNGPNNFFANPFYAGVEAVGEDKVAVGSVGGVIYISKDPNNPFSALSGVFSRVGHEEGAQPEVYGPIVGILVAVALAVLWAVRDRFRKVASPRLP